MQWDLRVQNYIFYAPAALPEVADAVRVVMENWEKTVDVSNGGGGVEMGFEKRFVRHVEWTGNGFRGGFAENWAKYQGLSRWVDTEYHYTLSVILEPSGDDQTRVTTSTREAIDEQHTALRNHQACQLPSAWGEIGNLGPQVEQRL
jgi:hypothetical protein